MFSDAHFFVFIPIPLAAVYTAPIPKKLNQGRLKTCNGPDGRAGKVSPSGRRNTGKLLTIRPSETIFYRLDFQSVSDGLIRYFSCRPVFSAAFLWQNGTVGKQCGTHTAEFHSSHF